MRNPHGVHQVAVEPVFGVLLREQANDEFDLVDVDVHGLQFFAQGHIVGELPYRDHGMFTGDRMREDWFPVLWRGSSQPG
jgi:hypothetical protein